MTYQTLQKGITWTIALLCLLSAGCATRSQSEHRKLAHDRWSEARASILVSLAEQQFNAGDMEKAEKACREIAAVTPDAPEHLILLGRIKIEQGKLEQAFHYLDRAIALDPDRSTPHYFMGVVLQRWRRYVAAYEAYQRAYQQQPDNVAGLLASAEMLVKLQRHDEAVAILETKLDYFENNAAIRLSLGRIYMLCDQTDAAVARFREALVLSPDDPMIMEQLAMGEFARGRYDEAEYYLQRLLEFETFADRSDLRLTLGDCYMAQQRPVEARAMYLKLTQDEPNNVQAWIKLAESAFLVDDEVRLRQAADRIVALAPNRHEGYLVRGMVYRRAGRPAQALREFQRAAHRAPDDATPWILSGLTLEQAGRANEAATAYRKAIQIAPNDPRPRDLLAAMTPNG